MRAISFVLCLSYACLYADQVAYKYDDAGRLILVDYGNGQTIAYAYDNAGNLLSRVVTASQSSAAKAKAQNTGKAESGLPAKSRRKRAR